MIGEASKLLPYSILFLLIDHPRFSATDLIVSLVAVHFGALASGFGMN
jgi:hypothetical protein